MAVVDVTLPKWGMTMQEGTVQGWLKQVGDPVAEGDAIAEVETEKAIAEVEAPVGGTLVELLVEGGTTVDVGTVIARIEESA
ncbi:MAG: biotin attachment protein [Solirubrobacterales bacterium]|jgi:pyruvate/2-oxoglutarate dehydrogenase complex dihydrolipoamide acyltransferase (E2) component|nr:biotin attachment protein [Solirubrobacterales bacterium]